MRLFTAIELPGEVKDYLFSLKGNFSKDLVKVNWVGKKNIHLTLKFLGNVDDKLVTRVIGKLKEINFKEFELELDNLGVFPNEDYARVLWVGVKNFNKVIELQQDIEEKLRDYFEKDKEFSAHITLGRVKQIKNQYKFKEVFRNFKIKNLKFKVDHFSLIKSELSRTGSKYTVIEKFVSK
ncbi:MAG: RNA 2',3'-cyclic phosphodiesterase [Nanoarchaeota archaeon]